MWHKYWFHFLSTKLEICVPSSRFVYSIAMAMTLKFTESGFSATTFCITFTASCNVSSHRVGTCLWPHSMSQFKMWLYCGQIWWVPNAISTSQMWSLYLWPHVPFSVTWNTNLNCTSMWLLYNAWEDLAHATGNERFLELTCALRTEFITNIMTKDTTPDQNVWLTKP